MGLCTLLTVASKGRYSCSDEYGQDGQNLGELSN